MEMMRLQGEQLQLLAASTTGLRKEVEELKSSTGKEKEEEEKGEPIPPITAANVARMEAASHLPRGCRGNANSCGSCWGGWGRSGRTRAWRGWKGGREGRGWIPTLLCRIQRMGGHPGTSLPGGSWWAWCATRGSMAPSGGDQRGGAVCRGRRPRVGVRVGGGVAAITQPGFYRGVEVALHQGELCFKTFGSNPKWVPLSGKPSQPCQRCIQRG